MAADLAGLRSELDSLGERLADAAYDSLRAQLHRGAKPSKQDPDLVREKLLTRARNAVERAAVLVAQAEQVADADEPDPVATDGTDGSDRATRAGAGTRRSRWAAAGEGGDGD